MEQGAIDGADGSPTKMAVGAAMFATPVEVHQEVEAVLDRQLYKHIS